MKKTAWVVGLCLASAPLWAGVKETQHQQMIDLANQMRELKQSGQGASPLYAQLKGQYAQISAAMGGDAPGMASSGSQVAAAGGGESAVPATPAGCGPTTATFTQSTPTVIPGGPAVVTTTVAVSGVGTYLFDLDLTTFITHTFPGDLDITITSPAGTVVTLTTDNAGTNDDVFNGTLWDDDANPAGQVPYTTNNGIVTDHAYVLSTLASPLTPEEPLAAFIGEDPNGTWTLTVSDDTAVDGGNIASWSAAVTTLPAAPTVVSVPTATQNVAVTIPGGPAVVSSTIAIAGAGTSILDVNLTSFITHTFPGDLDITITSPAGTVVTLTTDNAGTNDDVFNGTVWDDDANPAGQVPYTTNNGMVTDHAYVLSTLASPLTPEEPLGAFIGEDPNGTWTLTVSDDTAVDGGEIVSWSLDIDTFTCGCTIICPANIVVGNDAGQCGAIVNYPATGGTCTSVTCVAPAGSLFAVGSTGVTCSDPAAVASCNFNVTVNDLEPPVLSCPADIFDELPLGDTEMPVDFTPTVSDNCTGVGSPVCNPTSGSLFPEGTTGVNCSVSDGSQNGDSCGFNVNIGVGSSVLEIPTVSGRGLAALALLLVIGAFVVLRRAL